MERPKLTAIFLVFALVEVLMISAVTSVLTSSVSIGSTGTIGTINTDLVLHVEGKYIKDSQGNAFTLRGINKHGFENFPEGSWQRPDGMFDYGKFDPVVVGANLDAMQSWGINTVRSYSTAQFWIENTGNHRNIVKQYATLLGERGMYLVYTFWHTTPTAEQEAIPFPTTTFPDADSFVSMWRSIAQELRDYPNIIFALWNEPNGNSRVNEWFDVAQECINAIRAEGAENLILIEWDGLWYNIDYNDSPVDAPSSVGATMWWVQGKPLTDPANNLVYEFHLYRGGIHKFVGGSKVNVWEYNDLKTGFQRCLVDYVLYNLSKPVICGEIGPAMTSSQLQNELDFYENSLTIFNEWEMNYLGFWWWPAGVYAQLESTGYQANAAGDILRSAISAG